MTSGQPILLVEDNEDDAFIMRQALKDAGVTNSMHLAEDGQQAIEYLDGSGRFSDREIYPLPAIIFLDLKMPLKSGHEVLAWIRERKCFSKIVVVVLTSSEEPEDLRTSYRLGANSYLVKPPSAEQLLELAKSFHLDWPDFNQFEKI